MDDIDLEQALENADPAARKVYREEAKAIDAAEVIIADTQAVCAEMEGASIAHTAYRNGVPFVIIRAISDKADDSAQMDYPVFEAMAAKRCAEVVLKLTEKLA